MKPDVADIVSSLIGAVAFGLVIHLLGAPTWAVVALAYVLYILYRVGDRVKDGPDG